MTDAERPWVDDLIAKVRRERMEQIAAGTYDASRYEMGEVAIPMRIFNALPAPLRAEIAGLGAVERGGCAVVRVARQRYEEWLKEARR